MNNSLLTRNIAFLLLISLTNLALGEHFAAGHVASPEQYEVLLDNEHVLVLRMSLQPGESDKTHLHQNETVYFEKGGKLKITEHNGETIIAEVPNGHVMWHQAWTIRSRTLVIQK